MTEGPLCVHRRRCHTWGRCRHLQLRATLARMAAEARRRLRCGGGVTTSPTRSASFASRGSCDVTCISSYELGPKLPQLVPDAMPAVVPLGSTFTVPPPSLGGGPLVAVRDAEGQGLEERPPTFSRVARRDSLTEALRPALVLAQAFFVLPVHAGRWSRRARTATLLAVMVVVIALAAVHMFKTELSLTSSSHFIFYGTAALSVHLLSGLSLQWPRLSSCWSNSGSLLTEGLEDDRRTARICKRITIFMMSCALVEHVLSLLNGLMPLLVCEAHGGAWTVYKSLFLNGYPMIFEVLPFSIPVSIIVIYLNVTCTFLWNFIDLLVIIISYSLARRFDTFSQFLRQAKGKNYSIFWWQEVREAYNRLSLLTKQLDDQINGIVLLSFASNLYFICLQLLYNMSRFEQEKSVFSRLYFCFSFAWLLARAALVSMTAASVYEQSRAPTEVLYCVPSKSFNAEVQRFLVQTTTDTVALSGARFFWVTRSLVLTLAGTVATYEIVLVQFHDDMDKVQRPSNVCFP
ncbi:Gustatory receptor 39 [Frankliniella occidentalis]|nr:Gustatory receptor 39 [Frankliniella occidentalis]